MMKISDITDAIEEFAPLSYQESFDNAGLITGNKNDQAKGAVICVDVTDAVIDEAIACGANMIISHHPLIFSPLKSFVGNDRVRTLVVKAIKNDIALYAAHTNLDSCRGGLSFKMAEMLGLECVKVLDPREDMTGLGVVGELKEAQKVEDFLNHTKKVFDTKIIRHTRPCKSHVKIVAICSGSGGSMLDDAINSGADIYVTADIKYDGFLTAENQIILADIGHFESEYCAIDILYDIVTKKLPKFALRKSELSANPIVYLGA